MNTLRTILHSIVALAVLVFCADLQIQAHRIAADVHQAAAKVEGVASRVDATAAKLDADAGAVVTKVNAAVDHADATVDRAVNSAINPLPGLFDHQKTVK